MLHKRLAFFITIICLAGCSDNSVEPNDTDYTEMFNSFYENFDLHYSYFEYKNINRAEQKRRYEADLPDVQYNYEFIHLLLEMVKPLRDVHVWFRSDDATISSFTFISRTGR